MTWTKISLPLSTHKSLSHVHEILNSIQASQQCILVSSIFQQSVNFDSSNAEFPHFEQ